VKCGTSKAPAESRKKKASTQWAAEMPPSSFISIFHNTKGGTRLHVPPSALERANADFLVNPPAAIPVLPAPAVPAAVVSIKPAVMIDPPVAVKPLIAIVASSVIAVMVAVRAAVSVPVSIMVTVSISVCHILLKNLCGSQS
jgi:hypothetical protein